MADPKSAKSMSEAEAESWNAIAYFEKILEAMPNDRLSLEMLASAYEKVGDHTRAKVYALRLARVLADGTDEDTITELLGRIRQFDPNEPEVRSALSHLENLKPGKVMAL